MSNICKDWQLSGLDVWAVTPLNARVRIISIGKHADMNGIDHVAIARLVTAAPSLLEALKNMVEQVEKEENCKSNRRINLCLNQNTHSIRNRRTPRAATWQS